MVQAKRAAEAGNLARTLSSLAISYETGDGIGVDKVEAVKWYKLAAEAGIVHAQLTLGICYPTGFTGLDLRDVNIARCSLMVHACS